MEISNTDVVRENVTVALEAYRLGTISGLQLKDAQNAFNDNPWLHVGKNAEKKKKVSIHNISEIIKDGQLSGELKKEINSHETAVMIVSVIQGAYVLAKAENSTVVFHQAVSGLDNLLNSLKAKN